MHTHMPARVMRATQTGRFGHDKQGPDGFGMVCRYLQIDSPWLYDLDWFVLSIMFSGSGKLNTGQNMIESSQSGASQLQIGCRRKRHGGIWLAYVNALVKCFSTLR